MKRDTTKESIPEGSGLVPLQDKERLLQLSLETRREITDVMSMLQTVLYGKHLADKDRLDLISKSCHQLLLSSSIIEDFFESEQLAGELARSRYFSFVDLLRKHYQFFGKLARLQKVEFAVSCGDLPASFCAPNVALDLVLRHLLREAFGMVSGGRITLEVSSAKTGSILELGIHCQCDGMLVTSGMDAPVVDEHTFSFGLVSKIVRECGWSILVQNSRFLGVSFILEVPYELKGNPKRLTPYSFNESEMSDENTLTVPVIRNLNRKILVATKSDEITDLMSKVITSDSLTVEGSSDVHKIMSDINYRKTDLVFVDSVLPGMSGLRLIAKARELDPDTPIIALVPSNLPVLIERFIMAGADAVLDLPVSLPNLFDIISFYLDFSSYQGSRSDERLLPALFDQHIASVCLASTPSAGAATVMNSDATGVQTGGFDINLDDIGFSSSGSLDTALMHDSSLAQYDEGELAIVVDYIHDLRGEFGRLVNLYKMHNYTEFGFLANQLGGTAALCQLDYLRDTLLRLQQYSDARNDTNIELGLQVLKDQIKSVVEGRAVDVLIDHVAKGEDEDPIPDVLTSLLLAQGDTEMQNLVHECVSTLDSFYERMDTCYLRQDWEGLREVGHEASGVASMYGYPMYCDVAKAMNDAVKQQRFSLAREKIEDLKVIGAAMKKGLLHD